MAVYYANPGDNLTTKCNALVAGDTLFLNDGTYGNFAVNNRHGTAPSPILIQAVHDGAAFISGSGAVHTIFVDGSSYIIIQGVRVANSNSGYSVVSVQNWAYGDSSYITFRRVTATHAGNANNHVFLADSGSSYILYEDCAGWGPGRYMFSCYHASFITYRRCFAYWNGITNSILQPRAPWNIYGTHDVLMENCIGLNSYPSASDASITTNYFTSMWQTSDDTINFPCDNVTIRGCVFYNCWEGYWLNDVSGDNTQIEHCYFETPYRAPSPYTNTAQGDALRINGNTHTHTITNCTLRGSVVGLYRNSPYGSVTLQNCAFVSNTTGIVADPGHSYCGWYGNTGNGTTLVGTDVTSNPNYQTSTYGRGGALFIPNGSSYKGTGSGSADIGCTILYQYVDGSLTGVPLWPWPMEDRIVSELGQSPTYASGGGHWTTLAGLYQTAVHITVYATDTFIRANNASSWGTASDGVTTYTNLSGNGTFSISGNEGVYTGVTSTWFVPIAIGSTVTATADITYRASISDTMSRIGAFFNYTVPSSASLYRISFSGNTGDLRAEKRINGGTFATIGSPVTIAIIASNTFYNMRFQCLNGVLKAKVWNVGASEPSAWQLNVTDGSPLAAGQFGFFIHEKTSGTLWKFDHLTATNGSSTSTRNATGRTKVSTASLHMANSMGRVKVVATAQTVRNAMGRVLYALPIIATTVGRITGATGTNTMILGTTTLTDGEAMAEVALSEVGTIVGVTMRYVSLTNFVRLRLTGTRVEVVEQTATAFVILASYSFVPGIGMRYWIKLRATGSAVYGKVWRDGYVEPDWQVVATTTVVNDGQVGVSAALSSATATADFYLFQATSALTGSAPPTLSNLDVIARSGVEERFANQTRDIRARARLVDVLDVIDIRVYAAERPPLIRKFPKS